jgi:hypothetical protein
MRRLITLVAALSALVLVPAIPAAADDLSAAKTAVTNRIDLRLTALSRDKTEIGDAKALTDAHRSALSAVISSDVDGLTALKSTVAGETTAAALRTDAQKMVDDYRVFTLVGPQVRLTIAADALTQAAAKLSEAHDKLAAKAGAGEADDLAAMAAAISAAQSKLNGQADALLAIKPGPDLTSIRSAVDAVRQNIRAARDDERTALAKGRAVKATLKN